MRTKSRKTLKKKTFKYWANKCETLWKKIVTHKANGKCEICGSTHYLNCHHVFTRSILRTKFDPDNGCLLCAKHHVPYAHGKPLDFSTWIIQKRGQLWYYDLSQRAKLIHKVDYRMDIEGEYQRLEMELRVYEQ